MNFMFDERVSAVTDDQALTLARIVDVGSFEAAADELAISASAVSQRVRALETSLGRPVVRRTRPVELTDAGEAVVRYARRLELAIADLDAELHDHTGRPLPRITLVVSADALDTWALPALVDVGTSVQLTILREDQDHSVDLLRRGLAHGAITSSGERVPGCTSRALGTMRYQAMCSPDFHDRWFADGVDHAALASAPVVVFDDKDDLQDRFLRQWPRSRDVKPAGESPRPHAPRHYVPSTRDFGRAIALGLGWGMMPLLQVAQMAPETLVPVTDTTLDVTLSWQQWKASSRALDSVAQAISHAAAELAQDPLA